MSSDEGTPVVPISGVRGNNNPSKPIAISIGATITSARLRAALNRQFRSPIDPNQFAAAKFAAMLHNSCGVRR